jgi:hypothetical protein
MTLLEELLAERYPTRSEMLEERRRPVPVYEWPDRRPYRRGGSGLTRMEWLLMEAKR